jgi:hypothetical protein
LLWFVSSLTILVYCWRTFVTSKMDPMMRTCLLLKVLEQANVPSQSISPVLLVESWPQFGWCDGIRQVNGFNPWFSTQLNSTQQIFITQ